MRDPNKAIQTLIFEISPAANLLCQSLTVADLARQIRQSGSLLAVEKNGATVPESQHPATRLMAGDHYAFTVAFDVARGRQYQPFGVLREKPVPKE